MKYKILALTNLVTLLCFTSCAITGITNDYEKLNIEQKSRIIPLQNFKNLNQNNITR